MTSDDFFPSMLSIETRQKGRTKRWPLAFVHSLTAKTHINLYSLAQFDLYHGFSARRCSIFCQTVLMRRLIWAFALFVDNKHPFCVMSLI